MVVAAWSDMLGICLHESRSTRVRSEDFRAGVRLGGGWEGEVWLSCTGGLATRSAAAFWGEATGNGLDDRGICDAMGELANVLAGSLKVLAGAQRLSLPITKAGPDPGGRMVLELAFVAEEGTLAIDVLERS